MSILVYADSDADGLKSSAYNTVTAASQLGDDIHVLVAGDSVAAASAAAAKIPGISKVLTLEDACLANGLAENITPALVSLAGGYSHVLAAASTNGKNVMPRVAALLDVQQISEITEIVDADTYVRPIYAGNAFATVKSGDGIKIITVRSTSFEPAAEEGGSAPVEAASGAADAGLSKFLKAELSESERPELATARVVVSGGRGMGSAEAFDILNPIADVLGAAIGASRAAVDAGYVSNDYQVGQTGKVVAPDLYMAIGISGAIQHLAGMKDSKVIVAVNKDEEAPIFQVADYGLVADLFTAVPELEAALKDAVS